jgi:anti-anti-sigma factor
MTNLTLTREDRDGDIYYITATGRVGAAEAPLLQTAIEKGLKNKPEFLVVNMWSVNYLSSMGVKVLLGAYKTANNDGVKFRVDRPSECVRNILGMVALDGLLLK